MFRVKVLGRARREFAVSNAWWRIHRDKAPDLLRAEYQAALELLAEHPEFGPDSGGEIRRLLLRKSRYAIYYRIDHDARQVEILAFWHMSRETPTF